MVKTVARRPSAESMFLLQYLTHKRTAAQANKEAEQAKAQLKEIVEKSHVEDPEKGHHLHSLRTPLDFLGQTFTGFMNQRKVSQVFLEDKAEELCKEKGFKLDSYTSRYVDQDKIVRLYAEDKITQEEFDSLSNEVVTWAFVPIRD